MQVMFTEHLLNGAYVWLAVFYFFYTNSSFLFVFQYALAYVCLKLVNYSFFFWLPYYLHAAFGWSESTADEISIWYDVGGIIGKHITMITCQFFHIVINYLNKL